MYINATGYYIPAHRVPNAYFESINGLSDDWITKRTGIKTRSKAAPNENQITMGLDAVNNAVKELPYDIKDVNLIISAAYSPIDTVATLAHEAQRKFGITDAKAVAVTSACASLINGMEIIEGYFSMGKASKALLISSECNSYYANETDPKCGHLWGDGAVAFFISKDQAAEDEPRIKRIHTRALGHIGKGPEGVKLRPRESGITMPDGRDVFIHACKYMIEALDHATAPENLTPSKLDYIICHQANARIVAQVARQLDLSDEHFINNIEQLGNTGSASAGIVFAQNRHKFQKGENVGLTVFGGGYSCGACIIEI